MLKFEILNLVCYYDSAAAELEQYPWCDHVEDTPLTVFVPGRFCNVACEYFRKHNLRYYEHL